MSGLASVSFGGRPPVRPARRAATSPAWVRSRIRLRSNSANAPNMCKTSRPCAVVVSRASVRLAKPDTPDPQGFDGFDQLLHRPCQTVELPHDERVAAAREFERVV